jgi:hypothetical protein
MDYGSENQLLSSSLASKRVPDVGYKKKRIPPIRTFPHMDAR